MPEATPNSPNPHDLLHDIAAGRSLGEAQARDLFETLLSGGLDEAQIGGVLMGLAVRTGGPTSAEVAGAARAMRAHVARVPFEPGPGDLLIDTCGTGGTPKTFNISTAAALVAAAADTGNDRRIVVAKHGNRSRSGRGSAEVLSELGVNLDATPEQQAACLREVGVCFCFAIRHHPAMRFAAGPRKSLGFPTIFNILGPLTNPAGATRQLIGVYQPELVELVAQALAALGADRAIVAHGMDGLDELTTTSTTKLAHVGNSNIELQDIDAVSLGLVRTTLDDLRAGDLPEAAAAVRSVLRGEPGPKRDIVLLNAAAAIIVAGVAESFETAVPIAADAIDSGRAHDKLQALREISRRDA
ncbi:MAG: anthranilate phosphoribosyltransferase [Planctomycetota bacterium]